MKGRKLLFSLLFVIAVGTVGVFSILGPSQHENNPSDQVFVKETGIKGAINFYNRMKVDPATGTIDSKLYYEAFDNAKSMPQSKALQLEWKEMGPNNVGGRVRAILVDKDSVNIVYAGGVAGGLWKSTTGGLSWKQLDLSGSIAVSCIAQGTNGDIYVGTGEGLAYASYTNHNSGMFGGGIYKSTDGKNFSLTATVAQAGNEVNRIAIDKNGVVYFGSNKGLYYSDDSGASWNSIKSGGFKDVRIHPDATTVYATIGGRIYKGNKNGVSVTGITNTKFARIELAIAPSDSNIIYGVHVSNGAAGTGLARGALHSVQRSTDGGATWTQVGTGAPLSFNLFGDNNQGWYDVSAMVHLTNPGIIYVGGISLWKGEFISASLPFNWQTISSNYEGTGVKYVHSDQHALTQVPGNPNAWFIGCDGGVFKTANAGVTFTALNKNLNITQFFAVEPHPAGGAAGGTQDNSTPWVDNGMNNNPLEATVLWSGDGGWTAFSPFDHDFVISTAQYGAMGRSKDKGTTWQRADLSTDGSPTNLEANFFSVEMLSNPTFTGNDTLTISSRGVDDHSAFVTPLMMWQTIDYADNIDSVDFTADTNYAVGDVIKARSVLNNAYPFNYTLTAAMSTGDEIRIADKLQSRFYFGAADGIWMTKEALYWGKTTPEWFKIADLPGGNAVNSARKVWSMEISKDGDVLFFTDGSDLYRVSNLLAGQDSASLYYNSSTAVTEVSLVESFGATIGSIAIDHSNNDNLIVTLGSFSASVNHVYYSTNATAATPLFASKDGNLTSGMPVYGSVVPMGNGKTVVIGTEFGVMSTDDITAANPVWASANDGIEDPVPVYMLRQQKFNLPFETHIIYDEGVPVPTYYQGVNNYGVIYAATHGRGFFKTVKYLGLSEPGDAKKLTKATMKVYPNPVADNLTVEFKLIKTEEVIISVFDMNGRMVKTYNLATQIQGVNNASFNLSDLSDGVYIVKMQTPSSQAASRIIVR